MIYHFSVFEETSGFWAECVELDGCRTQADTLIDLERNCIEALNLFLEEPSESRTVFPLPDRSLDHNSKLVKVEVEPEVAFAVLLRYYRNTHNWTQKEVAQKMGMKSLYSYQRLEKKSNPTLNIIKKVKAVFPEMNLEYIV